MLVAKATRYWHTLRYLRPVQLYGRLWFRFKRPAPDLASAPAVRSVSRVWLRCNRAPSMLGPDRFCFLGVERQLYVAEDWNRTDWPKLWLYNAHYFDDLNAADANSRQDWHQKLIARWIEENAPGQGNGWEPYPSSLRIVNWVKWALNGNTLGEGGVHSLAVQTRYLRERLEIHLLGNHLWANAKALIFAGTFFDGPEAESWRSKGMVLLARELGEQILGDGGHFERSPMYHAILLEDVLDLVQLGSLYPAVFEDGDVTLWRKIARRMLRWLDVMTHPDDGIAFFNDAALGIAPSLAELTLYAQALDVEQGLSPRSDVELLPESGYARLEAGAAVVIADVGEVGPDYLPGHAHADTLSFEFSLGSQRVLVNGGTSTYEANSERLLQRGTAMHNTVQIDGVDSSEVWSSFRVARRARPFNVRCFRGDAGLCLEAAHDGYRRLPGKPVHRRHWRLEPGSLCVTDTVEGRFGEACARYRFHPSIQVRLADAASGTLELPDGRCIRWSVEGGAAQVVEGMYHPRFGVQQRCQCIELNPAESRAVFRLGW